jgi:anti-anti-sigma factor
MFTVEPLSEESSVLLTVRGRLDHSSVPMMALTFAKAIALGRREVIVDLARLESIDVDGIALIVRAERILRTRGQALVVRTRSPGVVPRADRAGAEPAGPVPAIDAAPQLDVFA